MSFLLMNERYQNHALFTAHVQFLILTHAKIRIKKKNSSIAFVDCTADDTGRYQLEASNACGSAKLGFGVNVVSKYLESQCFLEGEREGRFFRCCWVFCLECRYLESICQ